MMLYSKLHTLYYRLVNKMRKTQKKASWARVPAVNQMTYFGDECQIFDPHLIGPTTLARDCLNEGSIQGALEVMEQLEPDLYLSFVKDYYRKGLEQYGSRWSYADINTVLYGICRNLKVESYLEIGVRRGRSLAMVASQVPHCKVVGFDMWIENYAGLDNPGKKHVLKELKKVGYDGDVTFIDGDSKSTVPRYFRENPDMYFDLITVDGDHSLGGAKCDLENVMPRLKVGGVLVFDDICSQEHPYLGKLWKKSVEDNPRYMSYSFSEVGLGVGFAIRKY